MQKAVSKLIVTITSIAFIIYPLLCFAALSFNPVKWGRLERTILAISVMAALLIFIADLFNAKTKGGESYKI